MNRMLRRLAQRIEDAKRKLGSRLARLFKRVQRWLAGNTRADERNPFPELNEVLGGGFTKLFNMAARAQSAFLGLRALLRSIIQRGIELSQQYAARASESAYTQLRNEQRDPRAYGVIVANVIGNAAVSRGFSETGNILGAPWKRFTRVSGVSEPREHHGALQGSIIPAQARWNIGGYLVLAPHDPLLPLSETINCKHAALYGRTRAALERVRDVGRVL